MCVGVQQPDAMPSACLHSVRPCWHDPYKTKTKSFAHFTVKSFLTCVNQMYVYENPSVRRNLIDDTGDYLFICTCLPGVRGVPRPQCGCLKRRGAAPCTHRPSFRQRAMVVAALIEESSSHCVSYKALS